MLTFPHLYFITEEILLKHTTSHALETHTQTHYPELVCKDFPERLCVCMHQVDGALTLLPSEEAVYLGITESCCFSRISVAVYNIISVIIKGSRGDVKQLLLALNRV